MGYDYDDIKSSIEISDYDDQKNILWQTLLEVKDKFYNKMYAQRVAMSILNTGILKNDISNQYDIWFNHVTKEMIRNHKKILNDLKNENIIYQKEVVLYQKIIERMKNTLSWRLTSFFRNSTVLKKIMGHKKI